MDKLQIKLDAVKLRNLVVKNSYTNKDGEQVTVEQIELDLVPLKEPKQTFQNEKITMTKTHFLCARQTKEQKEAKEATVYVGEGFTIEFSNSKAPAQASTPSSYTSNGLPF